MLDPPAVISEPRAISKTSIIIALSPCRTCFSRCV